MSTYHQAEAKRIFNDFIENKLTSQQREDEYLMMSLEILIRRRYAWSQLQQTDFDMASLPAQDLIELVEDFNPDYGFDPNDKNEPDGLEQSKFDEISSSLAAITLTKAQELRQSSTPGDKPLAEKFLDRLDTMREYLSEGQKLILENLMQPFIEPVMENKTTAPEIKEQTPETRVVFFYNDEYQQLMDLLNGDFSGEALIDIAVAEAAALSREYEAKGQTKNAADKQAAYLKFFAARAIMQKKINPHRMNETRLKQLKSFLANKTVTIKKFSEEKVLTVLGWIEEEQSRRQNPIRQKTLIKKKPATQFSPEVQPVAESKLTDDEDQLNRKKNVETKVVTINFATPQNKKDLEIQNQPLPDEKKAESTNQVFNNKLQELCKKIEENLKKDNIPFQNIETETENQIKYDLWPKGADQVSSKPNGGLIVHSENNLTMQTTDYDHLVSVARSLRQQGFTTIKCGEMPADEQEAKQFKAQMVLAAASMGMQVAGASTAEELENLADGNPKIKILIEKKKIQKEMKELRQQLHQAREKGDETQVSALETAMQKATENAIKAHYRNLAQAPDCAEEDIASAKIAAVQSKKLNLKEHADDGDKKKGVEAETGCQPINSAMPPQIIKQATQKTNR